MQHKTILILLAMCLFMAGFAQTPILDTRKGMTIKGFETGKNKYLLARPNQLLTMTINGFSYSSSDVDIIQEPARYLVFFSDRILAEIFPDTSNAGFFKYDLIVRNIYQDTLILENIVPFGEEPDHVYITSTGPWDLARAKLFLPGHGPVGVILPDNAWEMGYGALDTKKGPSVAAIARRGEIKEGKKHRYETHLNPGGYVKYTIYFHYFDGEWQNGLRKMFQEALLFDLDTFDNALFEREDLKWVRNRYLIALQFAWDKDFYDWKTGEYTVEGFLEEGKKLFGGYDIYGLWPTWPRLGLDPRNQWDMFSGLSGGVEKIREISRKMQSEGTAFYICYNPWDESTRKESPYKGMARLIEATDANGVVLDCHGWSSGKYQRAADSIKAGVIMYSEGMAVVKDMPGIVSGRVHNAIYLSPPLNLNKLIKPDFAIFRVLEPKDIDLHREVAIAFFNGYGSELNFYAPGRPEETMRDFHFLEKTTRLLRENTGSFLQYDWTPLVPTLKDSVWVNSWPLGDKEIYTVLSMYPEGYEGPLFEVEPGRDRHLVSLWRHEELEPVAMGDTLCAPVLLEAYSRNDINTRREGSIECIALLPRLIEAGIEGNTLAISAKEGDDLRIWPGEPSCRNTHISLAPGTHELDILANFGDYQGKIVVQLFGMEELMDERVLYLQPGTPLLMAEEKTAWKKGPEPAGMALIPGGAITLNANNDDQFIPYPGSADTVSTLVAPFYLDIYPVTNEDYHKFVTQSGYMPADTTNYLRHWKKGMYPQDLARHPVVYVSPEDARAYARWAGKRLPTEAEWQFAAMGKDELTWPWGMEYDSTMCNHALGHTTLVDSFPQGGSPFGIMDLTGNVWQMTSDIYNNGSYYFNILKGGSFYKPTSSWWYVQGGPQPSRHQQMLLLVSPGLNRNSTVGFRCAKSAN
ncbi:MAG: formylglycine-generating enzyme family protein [Bacteroidetes bacterium]|nr:formylglycine-generating enzyme family protein [Bacteroidota bacterium]